MIPIQHLHHADIRINIPLAEGNILSNDAPLAPISRARYRPRKAR